MMSPRVPPLSESGQPAGLGGHCQDSIEKPLMIH
jgi:hypothetical protein